VFGNTHPNTQTILRYRYDDDNFIVGFSSMFRVLPYFGPAFAMQKENSQLLY